MNEQIRKIQEYVYAKYVDFDAQGTLDEGAAVRVLEDHYTKPEAAQDSECCYLGILYFERGMEEEDADRQMALLRQAKKWLERSRALSQETWDAVDDRLADVTAFFEERGIVLAEGPLPAPAPVAAPTTSLPAEIEAHGPMVLVPGGEFLFGPSREARLLPAFYVDKHPVTNRQYEAFYRATNYRKPKYATDVRFGQSEQPVVGVSFADAQKYCRWAGKELPSEEQWEKAARGTDGRLYPWGDAPPVNGVACLGRDPESGGPDPVGMHPKGASPWGAFDLAGGVWEWTVTTYEDGETLHVLKGGCFSDPPPFLRADARIEAGPKDKFENLGFRCVRPA